MKYGTSIYAFLVLFVHPIFAQDLFVASTLPLGSVAVGAETKVIVGLPIHRSRAVTGGRQPVSTIIVTLQQSVWRIPLPSSVKDSVTASLYGLDGVCIAKGISAQIIQNQACLSPLPNLAKGVYGIAFWAGQHLVWRCLLQVSG